MPCVGEFKNHRWSSDGHCERDGCTAIKELQSTTPVDIPANENIQQDNSTLEQIASGGQNPQNVKRGRPSTKTANAEQQKAQSLQRQRIAKQIAALPHRLQEAVAKALYGYSGNAFHLNEPQILELAEGWLGVLEAYQFVPDSPIVSVVLLALTEIQISSSQWQTAFAEMESDNDGQR